MISKNLSVLLANGQYPEHKFPLQVLKEAKHIICLDGAVNTLCRNRLNPNIIIGDMDSIDNQLREKYSDIIIEDRDQDENDLRKALKWLDENGYSDISILGATGLRDDHSIANIFSILNQDFKIEAKILTDYGIFQIVKNKVELSSFKGQPVSLFATKKGVKITTSGLKYNLKSDTLNYIYSGSLNESSSSRFTVACDGGKILLYTAYEK